MAYVIALAVVALLLVWSYRALSTVRLRTEDVPGQLADISAALASLCTDAQDIVSRMSAVEAERKQQVNEALRLRRKADGYQHQLTQYATVAADDVERSCLLLAAAAEDVVWSCKLVVGETYVENTGLQGAARGMLDHAQQCVTEAATSSFGSSQQSA